MSAHARRICRTVEDTHQAGRDAARHLAPLTQAETRTILGLLAPYRDVLLGLDPARRPA